MGKSVLEHLVQSEVDESAAARVAYVLRATCGPLGAELAEALAHVTEVDDAPELPVPQDGANG
jgi:hypothetical protein